MENPRNPQDLFDMLPYQMRVRSGGYDEVHQGMKFFDNQAFAEEKAQRIIMSSDPGIVDVEITPCVLVTFENGERLSLHPRLMATDQDREAEADRIASFARFSPDIKIARKVWQIAVRPGPSLPGAI